MNQSLRLFNVVHPILISLNKSVGYSNCSIGIIQGHVTTERETLVKRILKTVNGE